MPPYQKALQNSGYRHTLTYKRPKTITTAPTYIKSNEIGNDK